MRKSITTIALTGLALLASSCGHIRLEPAQTYVNYLQTRQAPQRSLPCTSDISCYQEDPSRLRLEYKF